MNGVGLGSVLGATFMRVYWLNELLLPRRYILNAIYYMKQSITANLYTTTGYYYPGIKSNHIINTLLWPLNESLTSLRHPSHINMHVENYQRQKSYQK